MSIATFAAQLKKAGLSRRERSVAGRALELAAQFLTTNNFTANRATTALSLESFGESVPELNTSSQTAGSVSTDRVVAMVKDMKVPEGAMESVCTEIYRIISGDNAFSNVMSRTFDTKAGIESLSLADMIGSTGAAMVANQDPTRGGLSFESFGIDSDRLNTDNRLAMALAMLRPFTSIMDKLLTRVAEETNVITTKVQNPIFYDLAASMNSSATVRYAQANQRTLISQYRAPDLVDTTPKRVVPIVANDTGTPNALYNGTQSYATGVRANVFDLAMNANQIGYNTTDWTDMLSDGGKLSVIYVAVSGTVGGVAKTETFAVPVGFRAGASLVDSPSNDDTGEKIVSLTNVPLILKAGSLTAAGAASSLVTAATGALSLNIGFNLRVNTKYGFQEGSGTVQKSVIPLAGQPASSLLAADATALNALTLSVVAFDSELFYNEENMRKTTIAARLNYMERVFQIPVGRNVIADYSLQQANSDDVMTLVANAMNLGNSIRGITMLQSRLSDVYNFIAYLKANPEVGDSNAVARTSLAGTVCLPQVVQSTISFNDPADPIHIMRESELLTELHSRMRMRLTNIVAYLVQTSLYLRNLEPNEVVVWKLFTSQVNLQTLFGIKDYHNVFNDAQAKTKNSDYTMELPNGHRLDIVATEFDAWDNQIMMFPIREADPTHLTSYATQRDRGTYVAQYTPLNQQGVARRVVTNSREIPFITNPVGALITVQGLNQVLGNVSTF